ncbi:hypothetical protein DFR58_106194 [Anaerobacterium chartisolvens]|uniref:Uncharacterized protein n=1 Tax=Anaerobacterium chartisolvens TaxID=1297424 RepID=A0A369B9M8_9FIRM|nr:hypothetical protein [Anaerobacterium chartisolvens]RCX18025.1 hypothetical protein DFR58_106194 [Anaerobacterium chartisolvens]
MSKNDVINMLMKLPDEMMFDEEVLMDALYNAYLKAGINAGLADVKSGRTYTQEQVEDMFCR